MPTSNQSASSVRPSARRTERAATRASRPDASDAANTLGAPTGRRQKDSVAQYLDEIGRYARLTREEEVELSAISLSEHSTDEEREAAQVKLVQANLRLVVSICKDFTRGNFDLLELCSPGNEGLIVAARKYDGSRGVPFGNYAAYWIKQRVMKYVAENGFSVRMPPYRSAIVNQVVRANARLMQIHGRQPLLDEVMAEVKCSQEEVEEVMRLLQPALELDAPLADESDTATFGAYFGESMADAEARVDHDLRLIDLRKALAQALEELSPREADVVRWHFGLDGLPREMELDEIGQRLGVTRERARQIKAGALKKLAELCPQLRQFMP